MNLDEINARVDEGRPIRHIEVKELIAEVERLTAENQQNADYADIYKDICDKYGKNFRALLDKAKALQTENAKLKKAYELACNQLEQFWKEGGSEYTAEEIQRSFIHQAERLTRETHGNEPAMLQTQDGKDDSHASQN
ncbi:MAG TPA: hypothetical protein VHP31_11845 [Caproicibacter sp.]|nr:hypothetical protein [Caproicibacter sp.]